MNGYAWCGVLAIAFVFIVAVSVSPEKSDRFAKQQALRDLCEKQLTEEVRFGTRGTYHFVEAACQQAQRE
jgi:hypothetical protein